MSDKISIVWFRNDLRLHDNEALIEALEKTQNVIPVYVFDPRVFLGKTRLGFEKCASFRAQFIIDAVTDLRKNLRDLGSELVIRVGKPEEELLAIAKDVKSSWIYCNRERTQEELEVQDSLEHNLWSIGQEIRYARGKMLFHTADLPFPIVQVPDTFTSFRKEVEDIIPVRLPLLKPERMTFPDIDIEVGEIPTLLTFGKKPIEHKHQENLFFKGGESAGVRRVHNYIWEDQKIKTYKESRDGMLGLDFSTKFSPWLSLGCVSPKYIVYEIRKFEKQVLKNQSTYWVFFELMWRDYFRLMGKKYGNRIFQSKGIRRVKIPMNKDIELFQKWASGQTGIPFIDANMRQLNETGFMSNRGRQNVASFLVKDLKVDWRLGAEYFESMLIDYDPCSNYGNWNYIAGIGNDPREDRHFNIISQARKYDADGKFIKYWLPELSDTPISYIHNPFENIESHSIDGRNYAKPIVAHLV
jgi:deoxyribodipyrimidine photo-lyase